MSTRPIEVRKPEIDKRTYRPLTLSNKMTIMLISDPSVDEAAASMSVGIGHYDDPHDVPGLAHFLEHMLFMGTHKYPDENYYQKLIHDNGGYCNAFTSHDSTNYYFKVDSYKLLKVLEIFSRFFIDPLLKPDAVEREMNAVDSEHAKNINNDDWREFQITKFLISPDHPYNKFGTGNLETLKRPDIVDQLRRFHDKYYSAQLMKLTVIGREDIDTLQEAAIEYFRDVPHNEKAIPNPVPPLVFNGEHSVAWVPVKNRETVTVLWTLPSQREVYTVKPIQYIASLLGHESEGSIYHALHKKGWITSLDVGEANEDDSGIIMGLTCETTEEGFKHVDRVIGTIMNYVQHILKYNGLLYQEIADYHNLLFRFMPKTDAADYAVEISQNMHHYPVQDAVSCSVLMENSSDRTTSVVTKFIDLLKHTTPRYMTCNRSHESDKNLTEKWYNIRYRWYDSPLVPGEPLDTPMHLPKQNPYLIRDLEMVHTKSDSKPRQINNPSETNTVWMKIDYEFNQPRTLIGIKIDMSDKLISTIDRAAMELLVSVISDQLTDELYYASMAGGHGSLDFQRETLTIVIDAYRSQDRKVLQTMLNALLLPDYSTLDTRREEQIKHYHNKQFDRTMGQAMDLMANTVLMHHSRHSEMEEATKRLTDDDLDRVLDSIISNGHVSSFIVGDIDEKTALRLGNQISSVFNKAVGECKHLEDVKRVRTSFPLKLEETSFNPDDNNSAIVHYLPVGYIKRGVTDNWEDGVIGIMLTNLLLSEPFYDQLRSKEQLGYIVKAASMTIGHLTNPYYCYQFLIQSPVKQPEYLRDRIGKFIEDSKERVQNLGTDEFSELVESADRIVNRKDNNLHERFSRLSNHIFGEDYVFDTAERLSKRLRSYDIEVYREFFNSLVRSDKWSYGVVTRKR